MAEILISKEILEYLRKDNGSDFSAVETQDGYLIKINNPEVERQLNAALKFMDEYDETLRILGK